jgi:hypothetical protein
VTVDSIPVVAPKGEAAGAALAKVDEKQSKAEAKRDVANAKAKAQAIVAEKRSQYLREKAAAEAAVMAEVRTRMRPIAAAEEQQLDSKEQAEARTADQVGEYAGLRVFGLGKHLVGGFGSGYVGDLACAYVRLQKIVAYGACVNADGEFRSEEAQSTARDTAQKEAEHMIHLEERIRYLMLTHSEIDRRLSREMVRLRNDHFAAAAKDDRESCAAYDYVLLFLSELSKERRRHGGIQGYGHTARPCRDSP